MAKGVYREYVRTPLANVAKDRLLRLCDNIIAPDYNINSSDHNTTLATSSDTLLDFVYGLLLIFLLLLFNVVSFLAATFAKLKVGRTVCTSVEVPLVGKALGGAEAETGGV